MTFKKADMAKTLKHRFRMIETNPLNPKWLDFAILTGLALHQFQTKWLLRDKSIEILIDKNRNNSLAQLLKAINA